MSPVPSVRVREVLLHQRPVRLRLPFRFGAATVTEAVQAFVHVAVEVDGRRASGATAELMVPKWFDKDPALTHDQNTEQLRRSLRLARDAVLAEPRHRSAHALSTAAGGRALAEGRATGLPRLAAQFGPAQLDKAVADAVLRATGLSWCDGLQNGVLGDPWSTRLVIHRPTSVHLRHTVGLADRLRPSDPGTPPDDDLPATLTDAVTAYGLTHFKLKLSGEPRADLDRLEAISAVLASTASDWRVTLDGNESFASADRLGEFWSRLRALPSLRMLHARTLLLEQPLPRRITLETSVRELGVDVPVIIDESDDHDEAFETALQLGYRGVSSKACKGLFRSLRNAARLAEDPAAFGAVLSGEDLTCQAGLAVQQDTLLAASLGVTHIERNGHHYVDGFGTAPSAEAASFARVHDGFYARQAQGVRLQVAAGQLDLRTLHGPGFATAVHPSPADLTPL
jgi:hypothetical protein